MSDFFHLVCLQGSFILQHVSILQFFLWLHNSPLYEYTMFYPLFQRWQWHPTPALLPGKSHGRRSLVGCSPGGLEESDTTEWLHFHFSLLRIGEENGNPLQCSCLENPRDGVTLGRTRLKWLRSSSIHYLVNLGCFHFVAIMNNTALHTDVSLCGDVFIFLRYITWEYTVNV